MWTVRTCSWAEGAMPPSSACRADDLAARDNRCTMHRRDAFDPATIRLMHRTTAEGECRV
jgi:hypothetical protein